ncbi:hypothetical protein GJU43_18500 [Flavobacterium sp. LC2016-23]|uniref:hypothetical protein n=1 Tax=Flavobacterium sp. LC2016-23 TaxID=2666330 RepID=UPI0012AF095E|nr:hypothetical protein [Flavobacterium sp. LC2016-23]MRX41283.1 hypothetical protein [Flavobacterium sp. LC2016-23]
MATKLKYLSQSEKWVRITAVYHDFKESEGHRKQGSLFDSSKMTFAVNSGFFTCLIPAKNKRIPTAEKINHLLKSSKFNGWL